MTEKERIIEVFKMLDNENLCWPNWFCNERVLGEFVRETHGSDANLERDAGYVDGGRIRVVGGNQRFRLVTFIRPAERGGWQATERLLIPEAENDSGEQPPDA